MVESKNPTFNFFMWFWSFDTRSVEMVIGMVMMLRGFLLMIQPEAMFAAPVYASLVSIFNPFTWGIICLAAGALLIGGVLVNGNWLKSPWVRFTGALIASSVFAMNSVLSFTDIPPYILRAAENMPLAVASIWTAINIASKT